MAYTTTWTDRGVIWKYSQQLTGSEAIESNMSIYGDPRFDELRYQILDLREVTENQFHDTEMRRLAYLNAAAARTNSRIRVALIANESTGLEIAQNYLEQMVQSPWEHRHFDTFETALAWGQDNFTHPPFPKSTPTADPANRFQPCP